LEPEKSDNILSWVRGDGASHATVMHLKKILATSPDIYTSFRNVISTPETWHTKATDLNSCASNHCGPAASKDPSSLSHSSNATNMKHPTDLKKCDFYPMSRNFTMIWEARVLDCWQSVFFLPSATRYLKSAGGVGTLGVIHRTVLKERWNALDQDSKDETGHQM
ncbi:hypothetical protein B0H14DRAFT_2395473, partial [Mycena olivaceomarginata]